MRIISGRFGGRTVRTVEGPGYRPATSKVRQSIFSMLESRGLTWDGLRAIDMFAGSGSLGIECLSRGAEVAWFVEMNARAARTIGENLAALGVERGQYRVLAKDLLGVLARPAEEPFGLAFIDPPYGKGLFEPALGKALAGGWVAPDGFVLAEVEAAVAAPEPEKLPGLELLTDRLYGQTRILLWTNSTRVSPSTPAPSTR